MYKKPFLYVYGLLLIIFLSACAGGGGSAQTAAVVRKHPAPAPVLPQGEPQVMTFEALTRVVAMTEEEILAAKREAMANAAFTETPFADVAGRTLKMQYHDGWLYMLQDEYLGLDSVYMTRTNGEVTERVGPPLITEEYVTYYFSFDENGEIFFLHSPLQMDNNRMPANSPNHFYSRYSLASDGGFTEVVAPTSDYGMPLENMRAFYYNGFFYTQNPADNAFLKFFLEGTFAEKPLPYEFISFNGDAKNGMIFAYYKNEGAFFGVFDLNGGAPEQILELPYNMTNIYGTSIINFNPLDESFYRATNNQFQKLDTGTGQWSKVLALGEETDLKTNKDQGTRYEYSDFLINENGEFFLAVSTQDRMTEEITTQVNKFTAK